MNIDIISIKFIFVVSIIIKTRIVHTADALRLLVIARYGGFYSDTDVVFLRFLIIMMRTLGMRVRMKNIMTLAVTMIMVLMIWNVTLPPSSSVS